MPALFFTFILIFSSIFILLNYFTKEPSLLRKPTSLLTTSKTELDQDTIKNKLMIDWTAFPGKLKNISAGKDGMVVGTDFSNRIWARILERWRLVPGRMKSVSMGKLNNLFGIDQNEKIWKYSYQNERWNKFFDFKAKKISVGFDDTLYIIGSDDQSYFFQNQQFVPTDNNFKEICVGSQNNIWAIDQKGNVFKDFFGNFEKVPGKLTSIACDSERYALGIDINGNLWWWINGAWKPIPGRLKSASLSDQGILWGVNEAGHIYRGQIIKMPENAQCPTPEKPTLPPHPIWCVGGWKQELICDKNCQCFWENICVGHDER